MNNKLLISTLAAAALSLPFAAAQAQEAKPEQQKALTRAEVVAELHRARTSGEYDRIHADTPDALGTAYQTNRDTQRLAKTAEKAKPAPQQ